MRQFCLNPLQVAFGVAHVCGSAAVETAGVEFHLVYRTVVTATMSLAFVVGQQLIPGGMCRACVCSGL